MYSDHKLTKPKSKKIKVSNCIVIGGMIAFGKSTLAIALNKKIKNSNIIFELNDDDQLMNVLLEKMYERSNDLLYCSVFQLYFVISRFENYKKNCNKENITIFDRSIFEDWLFARENIIRPSLFHYYCSIWKDITNELIYHCGVPKLYIILDGDWVLFQERLFKRNRKIEIDNFEKNKNYFKRLLVIYKDYLLNVCKDFGINYLVIDAKDNIETNLQKIINKLNEIDCNN